MINLQKTHNLNFLKIKCLEYSGFSAQMQKETLHISSRQTLQCYSMYLHPHVPAVFLKLLPHLLSSQSGSIQHQMLPLDWLEDVGVVRHIQANLHLGETVE